MTENQSERNEKKPGPIGERLLKLIKHYHLNMNSFSIQLNLPSNSIITRIVNDPTRGMSLDLIQKILTEFTGVNPDWFIMDRGEMLISKEDKKPVVSNDLTSVIAQKDETIANLRMIIKSKDEVIMAKESLIANLEGRAPLRKQNAS